MAYDLLLKGGHVLGPGEGLDGTRDIAIANGRIAAVEEEIAPREAPKVLGVDGSTVHAGDLIAPCWGMHPWGRAPEAA